MLPLLGPIEGMTLGDCVFVFGLRLVKEIGREVGCLDGEDREFVLGLRLTEEIGREVGCLDGEGSFGNTSENPGPQEPPKKATLYVTFEGFNAVVL